MNFIVFSSSEFSHSLYQSDSDFDVLNYKTLTAIRKARSDSKEEKKTAKSKSVFNTETVFERYSDNKKKKRTVNTEDNAVKLKAYSDYKRKKRMIESDFSEDSSECEAELNINLSKTYHITKTELKKKVRLKLKKIETDELKYK